MVEEHRSAEAAPRESHPAASAQARHLPAASADLEDTWTRTHWLELLAAERRARAEADAAGRRLELLARAGELLAHSLDPEDALQAIATTLVPSVADWCRIDLLDDDGALQRRLAYHSDPQLSQRAMEMARRMRAAPGTIGSMGWCIENGRCHWGRFDEPPSSEDPALRLYTQTLGMKEHFIMPLVARGRTIGAMGVVQGDSGRPLTEADRALIQELGQRAALALDNARAYAQADAARRQAETASRAKDEFLAMLGHELRNPLAPIATALELMARRDRHAHVEERRIIGRQVTHLSRLIEDLLDVSRITQGKVTLNRAPLDMRTVVAHALEQTQPIFERRGQPLALSLPDAPVFVHGDAVRLTQVLCNLLVNAAKFTPEEGRVTLALRGDADCVEVTVEDAGRGISAELLPHVFDLFVQGRQTSERRMGGLGLGLSIVRMLVEMHGGSVSADSQGEGHGSCFTVLLPASAPAQATGAPADAPQATAPAASGTPLLVVDDNADAAETLADLLRLVGFEVRCANDAASALELLETYTPQLALLDIGLPGLDGYELAARLREQPRLQGIKLVALTGYGRDNDRTRAIDASFDEHLVKPVAADRLFEVLRQMLGPEPRR